MQRQEELSEAYLKALAATMEEHREAGRLSAVVTEAAQDLPPEAAEVRDEPLVEAAEDVPPEAAVVRDEPLVEAAEAAKDVPPEAEEVRDEPLAVVAAVQDAPREVAAAVQDELLVAEPDELLAAEEVRDEPLAVAVVQDAPREAEEVRVEPQAGAQPSVAPQVSLQAARFARQQVTLPQSGPEVPKYEESRSQSLRAGLIEFVSWRPVREKESNNVLSEHFVPNDH
jgi:hypothetical protein